MEFQEPGGLTRSEPVPAWSRTCRSSDDGDREMVDGADETVEQPVEEPDDEG